MLRAVIATVTAGALIGTGCGASWPGRAEALTSPAFQRQPARVTTIDILPVDLELWTEPGYATIPEALRSQAEATILGTSLDTLTRRAYAIDALIDWNGDWNGDAGSGTPAMTKADVQATIASLARYGDAAALHPGRLPEVFLPARLGTATGADATLYLGGWAYVANHHESTGEKVAEGVMTGIMIVAAVGLIVMAVSALGAPAGSRHSHSSHDSRVRDHRSDAGDDGGGVATRGQVSGHGGLGARAATEAAAELADAFGRDVAVVASHPDWSEQPDAPHGEASAMYLEMTLVDNHTGTVLWHAHQRFPANAASAGDVTRVARTMLATLPAHG